MKRNLRCASSKGDSRDRGRFISRSQRSPFADRRKIRNRLEAVIHSKFCTCDLVSLPDIIAFVYKPGQTNISRNFIDFNNYGFHGNLAFFRLGTMSKKNLCW